MTKCKFNMLHDNNMCACVSLQYIHRDDVKIRRNKNLNENGERESSGTMGGYS